MIGALCYAELALMLPGDFLRICFFIFISFTIYNLGIIIIVFIVIILFL
jgi:hypothetical protein